ncbi:hypothetical protein CIHG_09417 [Coccidioides immitis H538.4]|uniref:Tc1-like transposase DDE domain-containing protein n=1 Tax=Coccidioides immitis H538.4 TaxID=396776 RepID=A0A0J8S3F4_COCIT|nr:hypothetical protein CIHG_09417 [Coccidioides immitis H538.4]
MFWGCFTYKKKGPCHIWESETAAAKHQAQKELDALNIDHEIKTREEWELVNGIHRLRIRPNCGRKPTFKFTVKTGKLEVLLAKLFPFVKECLESRPNTVVLEDGAPAHTHFYQQELYNIHKINRLLWPGNSPDLNMIEPAWMWLCDTAEHEWKKAWEELPQAKIQQWIERIPHHIQEVICLEGGNEYREGDYKAPCVWKGQRLKGKLSQQQDLGADSWAAGLETLEAAEALAALYNLGREDPWEDTEDENLEQDSDKSD